MSDVGTDSKSQSRDVLTALLVWLFSVIAVFLMPLLFAIPYILFRYRGVSNATQLVAADRTVLFLTLIGIIPAHLLTFAIARAVVTLRGKRPFWRSLGWSFGPRFGFWHSAGLAIALYATGLLLVKLIGGGETDIDVLANSSLAIRILLALVATTTGPVVEEIVYRGILYPTLQRKLGMTWAVVIVSLLFALVHVHQYRNSLGVISVILMLSISLTLVRAFTGRLLPSFIIHMIFNGIVSLIIIFSPYIEQFEKGESQKAAIGTLLWRTLHLAT